MNNHVQMPKTATEWSALYVKEWLREGETELWAGVGRHERGKPLITVVHCAGFDGEPPCIDIRIGKRLHSSVMATRNWQNERRAAIKLGMQLAGVTPDPAAFEAALEAVKAKQPSFSQQLAELVRLIAERLFQENGTWTAREAYETATTVARTQAALGPQAFRAALDVERSEKNQRERLNSLIADLLGRGHAAIAAEIVATKKKGARKGYLMVKPNRE